MARVNFLKLGLAKEDKVATFDWNGQTIEVKQYLPIQEKMNLITDVINQCQDENNFINEAKMSLFMDLEIIYRYTNINFTEKQKEDPTKLYDLFTTSGLFQDVFTVLPQEEYKTIAVWLSKTAQHVYEYRNSVYAILDALKTDYNNLNFDADEIKNKLSENKEGLGFLKDVLTKLG